MRAKRFAALCVGAAVVLAAAVPQAQPQEQQGTDPAGDPGPAAEPGALEAAETEEAAEAEREERANAPAGEEATAAADEEPKVDAAGEGDAAADESAAEAGEEVMIIEVSAQELAGKELVQSQGEEPEPVEEGEPVDEEPAPARWVELDALMQSVFFLASDSDFDDTRPKYDPDGQSVGFLATLFKPRLTLNATERIRMFYDLELGLNIWSKNNPDQYNPVADDAFFMIHRELWAAGELPGDFVAFKVGYQRFIDPSGLFLNHWIGVASVGVLPFDDKLWISVGQVPDSTYEGVTFTENNFKHDTFFVGLHRDNRLTEALALDAAAFVLVDNHVVGRNLTLFVPSVGLDAALGGHALSLDAAMQVGRSDFGAGEQDVTHLAWAVQGHGTFDFGVLGLDVNALLLSGDDAHARNDFEGAFLYSGKNRSATILLTEDELRDRCNNYDERFGVKDGGFYSLRSGLGVVDARLEGRIGEVFRPALIAGVGFVTASHNALGEGYAGTEVDLDLGFVWGDVVAFNLIGGLFAPGKAAAGLLNDIDPDKTEPVFALETALSVFY